METPPSFDRPVYSLSVRKVLRIVVLIPMFAVFLVMLLHHKAFINIETFGIPEGYMYWGGSGLILLALVPTYFIWRCPGCSAWLGNKPSPERCASCGAEFQ